MRYIVTFDSGKAATQYGRIYGENAMRLVSAAQNIYFIEIAEEDSDILENYCSKIEKRPIYEKAWSPIHVEYRVIDGGDYNEYLTYYFESGFALAKATDPLEGNIIGPWYVMSGYLGLLRAWNISQGSGVTVTCQEAFDYTHFGFRTSVSQWKTTGYETIYAEITGGNHSYMVPYSGTEFPTISSMCNVCYFYSGGDIYSVSTDDAGVTAPTSPPGCVWNTAANVPNISLHTYYNPRDCFNNNYGSVCLNGEYRWDITNIPSGFAPFGHGDIITSIVGARNSPIWDGAVVPQVVGNVGIAPQCNILLGNNGDGYVELETTLGADVRIGAFTGQWSQQEANLAHSGNTILVRGPGGHVNFNANNTNGETTPTKSVQIAPARHMGNYEKIYTVTGQDITVTGNYGIYSGFGRSNHVMFAAPSIGVWCHHPRYNYRDWGNWGSSADGISVSASVGGGLLAMMKSHRSDWSWEDIITAICQSCQPYEFRPVPYETGFTGFGKNTGAVGSPDTSFGVTQTNYGDESVNWKYAYPSGSRYNMQIDDHTPYAVLQFGNPTDSQYEQILYESVPYSIDDIVSGNNISYTAGTIANMIRGYGTTIANDHTKLQGLYTPLIRTSGWSEYLGWGIPDMRQALNIDKNHLTILPPERFTATLTTGIGESVNQWNSYVKLEITPFRSSNYGGITIIKSEKWYPRNVNDGTVVFTSTATGETITGYDKNLTCPYHEFTYDDYYYSAFQFTNGREPKYSRAALYAAKAISGNMWNITPKEKTDSLEIKIAPYAQLPYAKISGYQLIPTINLVARDPIYTSNNTVTITGLTSGDDLSIYVRTMPLDVNMCGERVSVWESPFYEWSSYTPLSYLHQTSISKYHDAKYDLWSKALTISGAPTYGGLSLKYNNLRDIAGTTNYNFSAYAKCLAGSGDMILGLNCYDGVSALVGFVTVYSGGVASGWSRFSGVATGTDWPLGTVKISPVISGFVNTDINAKSNTLLVCAPQLSSGSTLQNYNYYSYEAINPIAQKTLTYGPFGNPVAPSGILCSVYDNYSLLHMERGHGDIWKDSTVELYGSGNNFLGTLEASGGFVSMSTGDPNYIKITDINKKTTITYIGTYNDYRSQKERYNVFRPLDKETITSTSEPNFEPNLPTVIDPFKLSFHSHGVTGYGSFSNNLTSLNIKYEPNYKQDIRLMCLYDGETTPFEIGITSKEGYSFYRTAVTSSFKIQAISVYGDEIKSNVLQHTGG